MSPIFSTWSHKTEGLIGSPYPPVKPHVTKRIDDWTRGPIEEKTGNNLMNLKYPLIVRKTEKFHDGLKLVLARRGYFRLDKASFFIDDPFYVAPFMLTFFPWFRPC